MVRKVAEDAAEKKALDDIREFGHHVMLVGAGEDIPEFAYSIGLFETYGHPEVIILGLKFELAHVLINNIAYDIKNGKRWVSNEFHEGVLDDFLCYFGYVPQEKYPDYVGWARWFYEGDDFPLLQCVYPTVLGKFPWDNDFPDDARYFCQILIDPPTGLEQPM